MSNTPPASLLARLTGRRRRALRELEPADMGTAFGMEQWLGASAAEEAPLAAPAKQVSRSWRSRWLPSGGGDR